MNKIRLLIVDDHTLFRESLHSHLSINENITVVGEAEDGIEAINKTMQLKPDVVLMDSQMPQMDGLEATRRIKARWPEVRVVVVSMYVTHRTQALAAGADGFLSKGCRVEELLEAILDRQSG